VRGVRGVRGVLSIAVLIAATAIGTAQSDERDRRFSLTSNGRERAYRVFVPDGFGKSGPGPAVVLFNGSGSPVDGLMDPWKEIARKDGVILIGPDAFQSGAWRIPQDSPDFTGEVVEDAKAKFKIDPRRVYLFGHSGGAGHVLLLGLLESEYFAAVGAHAGALRPDDRKLLDVPQRKIPMAIWVGTKDQMVPLKMVRARSDRGGVGIRSQGIARRGPEVLSIRFQITGYRFRVPASGFGSVGYRVPNRTRPGTWNQEPVT